MGLFKKMFCSHSILHALSSPLTVLSRGRKDPCIMKLQIFSFLAINTVLAASVPPPSSIFRLGTQDTQTQSLTNTTRVRLGDWPPAPFNEHVDHNLQVVVEQYWPLYPDLRYESRAYAALLRIRDEVMDLTDPVRHYQTSYSPVTFRLLEGERKGGLTPLQLADTITVIMYLMLRFGSLASITGAIWSGLTVEAHIQFWFSGG